MQNSHAHNVKMLRTLATDILEQLQPSKGYGYNPRVDFVSLGVNTAIPGFVGPIEAITKLNLNFRLVLFTIKNQQLVAMSLLPNQDIGEEVHEQVDQFFKVEQGYGYVVINGLQAQISAGDAIQIPQGTKHNIIASEEGLKLYTIYSRPNHHYDVIDISKEDAEAREKVMESQLSQNQLVEKEKPKLTLNSIVGTIKNFLKDLFDDSN